MIYELDPETYMTFTLPIPVGINALYKSGKRGWYKSERAVNWQAVAILLIRQKCTPRKNIKPTGISITWFRKDKRKYDIDGGIKLLLDTIVKAGLIEDDSIITTLTVRKEKTKLENYCEVLLYDNTK